MRSRGLGSLLWHLLSGIVKLQENVTLEAELKKDLRALADIEPSIQARVLKIAEKYNLEKLNPSLVKRMLPDEKLDKFPLFAHAVSKEVGSYVIGLLPTLTPDAVLTCLLTCLLLTYLLTY